MPETEELTGFALIRMALAGIGEDGGPPPRDTVRDAVSFINRERDWLKHNNSAVSRFHAVYGRQSETPRMQEYFAEARRFDPDD